MIIVDEKSKAAILSRGFKHDQISIGLCLWLARKALKGNQLKINILIFKSKQLSIKTPNQPANNMNIRNVKWKAQR